MGITRALLFSSTTSAVADQLEERRPAVGLGQVDAHAALVAVHLVEVHRPVPRLALQVLVGPTQTSARVAGRVAHSTLTLSAPRSARNRPATGPAQFVVTSMIRSPSSGGRRRASSRRRRLGAGGRRRRVGVRAERRRRAAAARRGGGEPVRLARVGARRPRASHQSRAASCSSASTSSPSSTGVTAMRSSWPSSTISATVLSFAHSATASKIRGMLAYQVGMSTVRFSSQQVRPLDHHEQLVLGDDAHHVDPAVLGADQIRRAGAGAAARTPPTTTPARRAR